MLIGLPTNGSAHNGRGDFESNKSEKSDLRQRKLPQSRPRPQLMRLLVGETLF